MHYVFKNWGEHSYLFSHQELSIEIKDYDLINWILKKGNARVIFL